MFVDVPYSRHCPRVLLFDYCQGCSLDDSECEYRIKLDGSDYCSLYSKYLKPLKKWGIVL